MGIVITEFDKLNGRPVLRYRDVPGWIPAINEQRGVVGDDNDFDDNDNVTEQKLAFQLLRNAPLEGLLRLDKQDTKLSLHIQLQQLSQKDRYATKEIESVSDEIRYLYETTVGDHSSLDRSIGAHSRQQYKGRAPPKLCSTFASWRTPMRCSSTVLGSKPTEIR